METDNRYYDVTDLSPAYPVHPGGLIGDEIKERGISQKEFAKRIGMQASQLSAIIHGVRNVTPAVAAKLEMGFGNIPASFWLRFQEKYNLDLHKTRMKTSHLVSGYMPIQDMSVSVLPDFATDGMIRLEVAIPAKDRELFTQLAARFGWELERF